MTTWPCRCGETLATSGPIPRPDALYVIREARFDARADATYVDLIRESIGAHECRNCGRLWVWWNDREGEPTVYSPESRRPIAERDPERGRAAAAKLKALGVKGILIRAAEGGYIAQLACKMPECFCPEELGGACYFEPVSAELSDWMPTHEHFPLPKRHGGKATVDNAILAHRLCNRIDYAINAGRSYASDLARIRKAREDVTRPNSVQIGNTAAPEAEAATRKPKKTKMAPAWKSLPDAEKARHLLDHPTLSDLSWTNEPRLKGEKRDAFIRRILLG